MHPLLKEILGEVYGDYNQQDEKLNLFVSAVNEIIMDLEYEACIHKKLSSHFLNEYTLTKELLMRSNLK